MNYRTLILAAGLAAALPNYALAGTWWSIEYVPTPGRLPTSFEAWLSEERKHNARDTYEGELQSWGWHQIIDGAVTATCVSSVNDNHRTPAYVAGDGNGGGQIIELPGGNEVLVVADEKVLALLRLRTGAAAGSTGPLDLTEDEKTADNLSMAGNAMYLTSNHFWRTHEACQRAVDEIAAEVAKTKAAIEAENKAAADAKSAAFHKLDQYR
jgi:hypothetical protein